MSRLHLFFDCEDERCAASLDTGTKSIGVLIISGGNEIRSGPAQTHARLAAHIAARGYPVLRYDRRGIGDSEGENLGYLNSEKDINAALGAFRAMCPHVTHIVGYGNCDAASALMLFGGAQCDALILSNPWTFSDMTDAQSHTPKSLRSRYFGKLLNPADWGRLVRGQIDIRILAKGLKRALSPNAPPSPLSVQMAHGLDRFGGRVQILLCGRDRTAQAFEAAWPKDDPRVMRLDDAGHAYTEPHELAWLEAQILTMLRSL